MQPDNEKPSSSQAAFWYLDGATDGVQLAAEALEGIVTAEQMQRWMDRVKELMADYRMLSAPAAADLWAVKRGSPPKWLEDLIRHVPPT